MEPRGFAILDALLARSEERIALVGRCVPLRAKELRHQVQDAVRCGAGVPPAPSYAPAPPDLGRWAQRLEDAATWADAQGAVGALYADRARELLLEARLVATIGTPEFVAVAVERFPHGDAVTGRLADETALGWHALSGVRAETVSADAANDPRSLVAQIRALLGAHRLPIRVVVTDDLLANAAASDGVVYVRSGVMHDALAARRIAFHEVVAHAVPRLRARSEALGLFRVGARGAGEDEEGRALRLERDHGLWDDARRVDLARRHRAARWVREGADVVETARRLVDEGARPEAAVDLTLRAHRGGGLAREGVYLPALCRVDAALAAEPDLETWLSRGRVSLLAAGALRTLRDNERFRCDGAAV